MGARGRKSSAELSTIGPEGINAHRRPKPPKHLGKDAAALWRETVNGRAAETWPAGSAPILEAYCVLSVSLRRTLAVLDAMETAEGSHFHPDWPRAQKQAAELAGRVSMLATKLRITPQSTMHPRTAARHADPTASRLWERPWEYDPYDIDDDDDTGADADD